MFDVPQPKQPAPMVALLAQQQASPLAHMMGEKVIDGDTYQLRKVAAYPDGLRIFRKLHKFLLPVLATLLQRAGGGEVSLKGLADAGVSGDVVMQLAAEVGVLLADDEFFALVQDLWRLGGLRVNGEPIEKHPLHLNDKYTHVYQLAWFALEHNFGAAFKDAVGKLPREQVGANGDQSQPRPATSTP